MDYPLRVILLLSARVLSYPEDSFFEDIDDIFNLFGSEASQNMQEQLKEEILPLHERTLPKLREIYVSTFDLKDKTGLYLTAHELGDSRKRGAAMIKLQKIINEAGFEREEEGELADFMPMLYEFLAVAEENRYTERLIQRLAFATQRVRTQLNEDSLYMPIFDILMTYVFEVPTKEQIADLESRREEADLDVMPYPLMYG